MLRTDRCWRGVLLLVSLLLLFAMPGFAIQTTNVQGVVYRADGSVAQGTLLVSWPSFTAVDGSAVAAGNATATIGPDGSVNMALAPNAGANPQGTYYTVVYHMRDGTVQKEYWVVPQAATATIAQMRARVVPAAVAQQSVTQQYVDTSISALQGSFLQLKGGTMSGALHLSSDPTDAMQAATKEYVDTHAAGAQLPAAQNVIAGSGNGGAVSLAEKGVTVAGTHGKVAWDEDLNAGIYDPRDPRWAGGIYGPTPAAAAQAMSNQMACDLAMGVVAQATAKWPQGNFPIDQLVLAPGSNWEGASTATGGTLLYSTTNNHPLVQGPASMAVTCSDGQSHTASGGGTRFAHFLLQGCATGGCTNAAGDTANYTVGGPGNVGIEMSNTASVLEYVYAKSFGGYGIRLDGMDSKAFHLTVYSNGEWFYYGGYKGVQETAASAEVNATTTGSTGSVALSWPAVSGAGGYIVYRGTAAGAESVFYIVGSNAVTDTGAAVSGTSSVTNVVTSTLATPGTITATPSTSGGTLAAGTYYYRVTAIAGDGWHGSIEFGGTDDMADWVEAYGLFDAPTVYTYHHLADIVAGGGNSHFDHFWPQLGQVGITEPQGSGPGDSFENIRIDFARLEGFFTRNTSVSIHGGQIDGSCTAANAQTINTGQEGAPYAGTCNQYVGFGDNDSISDVWFSDNTGFGPTYKTADILTAGSATARNVHGATYQNIFFQGTLAGSFWEPETSETVSVTGPTPSIMGLQAIYPADTSPTTYLGFVNLQNGQDFYIRGGNSNATLQNWQYLSTCSGRDINMGSVAGYLHFKATAQGWSGQLPQVAEVCPSGSATVASSETVAYSATPTFSTATRASILTLTGNVSSFTLPGGADGQEKTLTFCQGATGGFNVTAPSNVHGFFNVGGAANKCSSQHFTYAAGRSAWLADSPGVINE